MKFGIVLSAIFGALGVLYTPYLLFSFLYAPHFMTLFWLGVWGYCTYVNLTSLHHYYKMRG